MAIFESPLILLAGGLAAAFGLWLTYRFSRELTLAVSWFVFLLPFERIPTLDVAGLTLRLNHVVLLVTLILFILEAILAHRKFRINPFVWILLLFQAAMLLSFLGAEHQVRAGVVTVLTIFTMLFALLIPQLLVTEKQVRQLVTVLLVTTTISVLFAGYQFVGDLAGLPTDLTGLDPGYTKKIFGFPRPQAFGTEPLYFGNFLLLPLSVAFAFLLSPQRWIKRELLVAFFIATGATLALTLSRGAILGFIVSLLAILLLLGRGLLKPRRIVAIGSSAVLALLVALAVFSSLGGVARDRFFAHLTIQDFGQGESTAGRLLTWSQAWELWQTAPVFGIGPGNFGPAILKYPDIPPVTGWPIVNNEYFELLAEMGVVGLSLFVFLVAALLVRSFRAYLRAGSRPELRALLVGVIAAFAGLLFQYNFFSTLYLTMFWVTVGLLIALQNLALQTEGRPT